MLLRLQEVRFRCAIWHTSQIGHANQVVPHPWTTSIKLLNSKIETCQFMLGDYLIVWRLKVETKWLELNFLRQNSTWSELTNFSIPFYFKSPTDLKTASQNRPNTYGPPCNKSSKWKDNILCIYLKTNFETIAKVITS